MNGKNINVRLPEKLRDRLEAVEGITRIQKSTIVRECLEFALDRLDASRPGLNFKSEAVSQ